MSSVMENFKAIPSLTPTTADENLPVNQPTNEDAIPKEKKLIRCDLCGRTVNSEKQAQAHLSGLYHLSRMQTRGLPLPPGTDLEKLRQYNAKAMRAMKVTQGGIMRPPVPGPSFYNRRPPPPPPQFEPRMPGTGMSMTGMPLSGGMPTAGMPTPMNSFSMTPTYNSNAPAKCVMCDICGVTANSPTQAQSHLEGRKHLTRLVELGFPLPPGVSAEFLEATSASMRQRTNFEAPKMQIQERFAPHHRVPQFQTPRFQYSQPHGPRMYPFRTPNAMMNNAPFHNGPLAAGPRGPSSYPMRVRSFIPCEVCQLLFNSEGQAQAHFSGSKHQKKVRMVNYYQKNIEKAQSPGATSSSSALKQIVCPVCSTTVNSDKQMDAHVQGKLHKSKLEQKPASEEKETGEEEKAAKEETEVKADAAVDKVVTKSFELANCVPGSALLYQEEADDSNSTQFQNPGIYPQQQQQHFSGTESDGAVAAKQSI